MKIFNITNLKEGDVEKCAASNALKFTFSKHGGERVGTCTVCFAQTIVRIIGTCSTPLQIC